MDLSSAGSSKSQNRDEGDLEALDSSGKKLKCQQCNYQTIHARNLKSHIWDKHPPGEEIQWHSCNNCSYKAPLKGKLRSHIRLHHGLRCLKHFDTKSNKAGSSKSQNKNEDGLETLDLIGKKYKCPQCNYESNCRRSLKTHIVHKHTATEEIRWHRCNFCPYTAITQKLVKVHTTRVHGAPTTQTKLIECQHCSYKTKNRARLRYHTSSRHAAIKWFKCEQCSYKSRWKRNLQRHVTKRHVHIRYELDEFKTECLTFNFDIPEEMDMYNLQQVNLYFN